MHLPEKNENCNSKIYISLWSLQHYLQQPRYGSNVSVTDEWIEKRLYVRQWNSIQTFKKKKPLPFAATRMDLEGIMLSDVSQRKTSTT